MLGVAVWLAAKNALQSLAGDAPVTLSIPATGEELLTRMTALVGQAVPDAVTVTK
jgi:hypothetical protein